MSLLKKLTFSVFSEREFDEMHYICTNPCLGSLLICFSRDRKDFYQSSLGNKVGFTDIMNISSNFLAKY